MMGRKGSVEPCRIGEVVAGFVESLERVPVRCDSVTEALEGLLPPPMRGHCRLGEISGGSIKIVVDSASYMYELQLCKAELLEELRRVCPGAGVRRIGVTMSGQRR
jgi:Dna[CI] antecedent DciA-like protein